MLGCRTPGGTTNQPVSHTCMTCATLARKSHAHASLLCSPSLPAAAPTYHSKLFLDCCGLVRRALRDLKDELGFTVGPGNQAYQVAVMEGCS